jgi:hypothetical protein
MNPTLVKLIRTAPVCALDADGAPATMKTIAMAVAANFVVRMKLSTLPLLYLFELGIKN